MSTRHRIETRCEQTDDRVTRQGSRPGVEDTSASLLLVVRIVDGGRYNLHLKNHYILGSPLGLYDIGGGSVIYPTVNFSQCFISYC